MSEVRLIDADELEKRVRDDIRQYDSDRTYNMFNQMKRDSLVEIAERIECAPTVDAVPVEWIQGFMNRLRNKGQTVCVAAIQGMLEAYGANGEREPANGYGVMAARMLE